MNQQEATNKAQRLGAMSGKQAVAMTVPGWLNLFALVGAIITFAMQFQGVKTRQDEVVRSQEAINRAFSQEHRDFRALFLDLNADVRSLKAWREFGDRGWNGPGSLSEYLPVPDPLDPAFDSLVEERLGRPHPHGSSQG